MDPKDLPANTVTSKKELKRYTGTAGRVLDLLIGGATQEQTAHAVGVNPSYVSQLCSEEDFQIQIVEGMKSDIEKSISLDKSYLEIEVELIKKLKALIPFMFNEGQILRALKFVNEAKKKTQAYIPNSGFNPEGTQASVAKIVIPTFIQQNFILNPNREVVGVDGRELVTLNSKALENMVSSKPALPNSEVARLPDQYVKSPNQSKRALPADYFDEL